MNKRMLHSILFTTIALAVLLLLVRHFQFSAATPAMPSSNGLLGD